MLLGMRSQRTSSSGGAFDPSSLTNLVLWLDAADSGSITQTGGAVSQWNDKSASANNAVQATGANQPTTATFNSHSAIRFNPASSQHLHLSSALDLSASAYTAFVAVKFSGSTPTVGGVSGYNTSLYYDGVSGVMYWTGQASVPRTNSGVGTNALKGNVVTTQVTDSVTALIRVDGTGQAMSQPAGAAGAFDAIGTGWGGQFANCYLFEVALYSRALNLTEIGQVEAYLKTKWNTP